MGPCSGLSGEWSPVSHTSRIHALDTGLIHVAGFGRWGINESDTSRGWLVLLEYSLLELSSYSGMKLSSTIERLGATGREIPKDDRPSWTFQPRLSSQLNAAHA